MDTREGLDAEDNPLPFRGSNPDRSARRQSLRDQDLLSMESKPYCSTERLILAGNLLKSFSLFPSMEQVENGRTEINYI